MLNNGICKYALIVTAVAILYAVSATASAPPIPAQSPLQSEQNAISNVNLSGDKLAVVNSNQDVSQTTLQNQNCVTTLIVSVVPSNELKI